MRDNFNRLLHIGAGSGPGSGMLMRGCWQERGTATIRETRCRAIRGRREVASTTPGFMAQHRAVQRFLIQMPLRHEFIHVGCETVAVVALYQVYYFMYDNIFKTMFRLFCEFKI